MSQPLRSSSDSAAAVPAGKLVGAWAIDFAVLAAIAVAIAWATYSLIIDSLRSLTDLGSIGLSNVLSGSGDWLDVGTNAGMDVLRNVRFYAAGGLVAVLVVAAAYYWLSAALASRTLGMTVVDVRLGCASDPDARPGWSHSLLWAVVRAVTDIGVFAAACAAPMFGAYVLAFLLWVVSVAWLLVNGLAAMRTGRSIVDRAGGLVAVPAAAYANAVRVARGAAGSAAVQAQQFAQQAQRTAGQLHANGPERVQQTVAAAGRVSRQTVDRARQAMEAERAAQAAEAGRKAATAGRKFAGDMKRRLDDRRQ